MDIIQASFIFLPASIWSDAKEIGRCADDVQSLFT